MTAPTSLTAGLFEALVASSDDAILSKDRDAIITTWNGAAERLYGYSEEEAIGAPVAMLIPPHRAGEERRILRRVLAGERVEHYETERVTKGGRQVDISLTVSPILGEEGEIEGASVIARDITERRRAEERAERLQRVSLELGREIQPEQTVEVLLEHALPALAADAGAVALLDDEGEHLELVGTAGYSDAVAEFSRMPLDADLPMTEAVRTGEALWSAGGTQLREAYPELERHPDHWASLAIIPLVVGASPFGAVALSFAEHREFSPGERAFMVAIVQQAAYALERARMFEIERNRRRQLDFLVEASEMLASSLDVDETLQRLAALAVPTIADWCGIDLAADDGSIRSVAVAHVDPDRVALAREFRSRYRPRPGQARGVANVIRTGRPELYPLVTDELLAESAVDGEQLRMIRRVGMVSVIIVPLAARGRTLGAMTLVTAESGRRYAEADLALGEELARHAALAVDNANLYRREHEAAVTLQRALLPARLPSPAGAEIASRYLPAGPGIEVGGDWYDLVETDDEIVVVVGDVAGRGLGAATIMGRLRTALHAYVLEGYRPVAAVERLNVLMGEFDEASMATLVHLALDPASRRVEYVRAGHPPPLIREPGGSVRLLEGRGSPPLGVLREPSFRSNSFELEPGSTLLLYTDGLIERPPEGIVAGLDRLRRALAASPAGAEECVERIVEQLGARALADDVAVVALRFLGIEGDAARRGAG